ncbi:MAG: PilZ domain-containing protein [Lachnospiraceae bacterium]
MDEKRRAERLELISKIQIKRLDNHHSEEVPIDVFNLSKRGIGFTCSMELPKGSMYEGELTIWTKEVIHVFMEIVRKDQISNGYSYGGTFLGMPDTDINRMEVYQIILKMRGLEGK